MDQSDIEVLVGELESRVDRLRALYEQYFLGFEKTEPLVVRKDVERRFDVLRKAQFRNTALRFRFTMMQQRFSTLSSYWMRICRQIEEGTFKRHVLRAKARFGDSAPQDDADAAYEIDVELDESEDGAEFSAADFMPVASAAKPKPAAREAVAAYTLSDDDDDDDRATNRPPPPLSSVDPFGLTLPVMKTPQRAAAPILSSVDPFGATQLSMQAPTRGSANSPAQRVTAAPPVTAPPGSIAALREEARRLEQTPAAHDDRPPPSVGAVRPKLGAIAPKSSVQRAPIAATQAPIAAPARAAAVPAGPASQRQLAPNPREPVAKPVVAAAGLPDARVRELYASYIDAKRKKNESTAQVTFESVAKTLNESTAKLREKFAGKKVDFEVSEKDGRVVLKPVVKAAK